jgi:hypothetical protein
MKKYFVIMLLAVAVLFSSSCKDNKNVYPPMTGYWLCTGIGGDVFGTQSNLIDSKFLSLFSVGYVGFLNSGYYTRVGAQDMGSIANLAQILQAHNWGNKENWEQYFTWGQFAVDEQNSTVKHTLKNGETETLSYEILDDGNTLKLTTSEVSIPGNSVTNIINDLFGTNINTNVGIVYTYKKVDYKEIVNAIQTLINTQE